MTWRLTSSEELLGVALGFWLLIANFLVVERLQGENNLDARGGTRILILVSFSWILFNDEERVDLVDVADAVSDDGSDIDGSEDLKSQGLEGHGAASLELGHHEGDESSELRFLGNPNCDGLGGVVAHSSLMGSTIKGCLLGKVFLGGVGCSFDFFVNDCGRCHLGLIITG